MIRGICFQIPNKYGKFLDEILSPIEVTDFSWRIGGEESYLVSSGVLGDSLFPDEIDGMPGENFKDIVVNNEYYLIFQDLKAYPKGKNVENFSTYREFLMSDCFLVLLVVDSSYVTIYCKDKETLKSMYSNARRRSFTNVKYITDDNDIRTRLTVW